MRPFFILFFCLACLPCYAQQQRTYTLEEDLIYRINFGSADDIRILLHKGANPNAHTPQGDPALSIALDRSDSEGHAMALLLIDNGANPNTPDKDKNYPLVVAQRNGQIDIFKDLLDKGANPDTPDKTMNTPLVNAVKLGQVEVIKLLMSKGADVTGKAPDGTPLIELAKASKNKESIALIQEAIDKEAAYAASLRTPERFKDMIHQYGYHSCLYQYWSYFLASRQDTDKDRDTQRKIEISKTELAHLLAQIQKYYPSTKSADLQDIANAAAQRVYDSLDSMISNRNRAEHGIGKDEDARDRCQQASDAIRVDFVPTNLQH